MTATEVGLAVAAATLLMTLLGIVWKGAVIAGEMHAGLAELRATVAELKEGLKQLAEVPLLKQRVEQLEHILHSDVRGRLATVWDKLFSLDKRQAVQAARQGSSPDLDKDD